MYKLKNLFLLALMLTISTLIWAEKPIKVNYEYMLLDMCNGKTAAYLKFYQDTLTDSTTRITRVDVTTINQVIQTTRTQISENETEIFDLVPSNDYLEFEVKIYDSTGRITTKIIRISTKDDSMVNVTERLYKYIDEYTKTRTSAYTFWCGKKISKVELFAFFQKFMRLTPQQICDMVTRYNQVVGTNFTQGTIPNDTWLQKMCELFNEFHNSFGLGGGGGGNDCLCKMIRTKQSALNVQGEPNYSEEDDCMNYTADTDAKNFDNKPNDNDHIFSQGRIGAAKAARMHIFYDGVDSSPTNFKTPLHQGWSTIRYRLVCVDPVTITPNLENCKSCKKQVEVEYGYYSKTFLTAHAYSCVGCTQGAWITIEDWAMMFATKNGVQQDSIIQGQKKFNAICDNPDEPSIDSVLTSANSLVNAVTTAIGSATTANIFAAATATVAFYNTFLNETLCDELNLDDYTLFSGQKRYEMSPGDELKFTIVSNATFGGRVKNHGESIAQINSDFYLATVLTTIPDETDSIPAYCECEKIAAYALGSLNTSSEDIPPVDEPNNTNESNWNIVFDDPPFGLSTMQQLTGSFIGSFGPWPGAFETTNCCDVKIKCMSDCVALTGCGENPDVNRVSNTNINVSEKALLSEVLTEANSTKQNEGLLNNRSDINNIRIYPNPLTSDELSIVTNTSLGLKSISVYDMRGSRVFGKDFNSQDEENIHRISLPNLNNGMYIILLTDEKGNNYWNKIIKQ
jgi:hypothetical protein